MIDINNIGINIFGNVIDQSELDELIGKACKPLSVSKIYKKNIDGGERYYFFITKKFDSPREGKSEYFIIKIDFENFIQSFLAPLQLTKYDFAWLLDADGNLIFHPNHKDMLLRNIFSNDEDCGECHSSFEMQRRMLVNSSGMSEYTIGEEPTKIMGYFEINLGNTKWTLAISTYLNSIIEPLSSKLVFLFVSSGFVFIFILALTLFGYKNNMRRIKSEDERKRIENEKKYQENLYQISKLASLGELIDAVAHEVNTPVGIIAAQVDSIRLPGKNDSGCAEEIGIIRNQINRISKYTNSLLSYSRRLPFNPESVNIETIIEECVYILEHRLKEKKITVEKEYLKDLLKINGDKLQLEQVFINLLNN